MNKVGKIYTKAPMIFRRILYLTALLLPMGCSSKITYVNGDLPDFRNSHRLIRHHMLGAIFELSKPVPVWQICRDGFSRIDSRESLFTPILTSGTRGIYSPSLAYVQCENNAAYLLKIDSNGSVVEMATAQQTNGPS
jgi:hypothetical protein